MISQTVARKIVQRMNRWPIEIPRGLVFVVPDHLRYHKLKGQRRNSVGSHIKSNHPLIMR